MNADRLKYMYNVLGMSDRQIAESLQCHRTTVVRRRQQYNIQTRVSSGRISELLVIRKLETLFGTHNVIDMNESDRTAPYDILLNNHTRIEVKSSQGKYHGSNYSFCLSNKADCKVKQTDSVTTTDNGRTIKRLDLSCDYVILVLRGLQNTFIVLPSSDERLRNKTSLYISDLAQYEEYINNFELLN